MAAVGLSQVLVSDHGLTTTHMLFGLDLILQDDGTETRNLLADGLGNTRTEMVGNTVETTTTYEPYGKLLAQTGASGTVYGYTGEAHDASSGLVFLRARYYNPYLNQFLSRDPFPGYATLPASLNGYNYAHNNPVNNTDPTGLCAEFGDDGCWSYGEYMYYSYFIDWEYVVGLTIDQMKFLEQSGDLVKRWYPPNHIGDEPQYGLAPFGAYAKHWEPGPNPDGISAYGALPFDMAQSIGIFSSSPVVAIEYLYNYHTADATLFLVLGNSAKVGAGTVFDDVVLSHVYNLGEDGKDNLSYSGDFNSYSIAGSYGLGLTGGHSWNPGDFREKENAYSNSIMLACGTGAFVTYSETEYIPVYTVKGTGIKTYHAAEYLYYTGNGRFSSEVQKLQRAIEDAIDLFNR
jgi:RHS repeat-associated protein